ncbi:hypothetical protein F2Q69_00014603 [Brassica cretica]|uniref:Uncharacterized protein n=1 Tax=Brassica cretica TaxID=69181 RepID=A0A8S9QNW0_BRACR|nr:hypothetical protein F2Q69_00014603 [Brassica cretica]
MYHQFNSTSCKAFASKYGEFGEDASIECLLAALAEVAFFIGLEKKFDIVEMARLHTHKGNQVVCYVSSIQQHFTQGPKEGDIVEMARLHTHKGCAARKLAEEGCGGSDKHAFVSKYGEFGEDASIEYLLAALAEVAFFIGLEKKIDIVEMARLHTHKGTSGKIYAESVEPELSDSFKMCFDFQIRTQAVIFGATSLKRAVEDLTSMYPTNIVISVKLMAVVK